MVAYSQNNQHPNGRVAASANSVVFSNAQMAVPNIGTPRTLAGEESFDGDTQTTPVPDMASSMMRKSTSFPERDNSHHSNRLLSTPRLHKSAGQGEFTPLMKSVMKNNLTRSHANSPGGSARRRTGATPRARTLDVIGEDSMEGDTQSTPVPDIASSMMQGTPLAERDNNLIGDGQAMTLKEQEQVSLRVSVTPVKLMPWALTVSRSSTESTRKTSV